MVVNSANEKVNVYRVNPNFSFSDIIGMAHRGDLGIVLERASSDNDSILYHYVKVLFSRGIVGIVHHGLIYSISIRNPGGEFDELEPEGMIR